uniref:Uncharacterized protein n=1 Tax=Octopus bimaculoides TaxID=37653 RepID=A0A0L8HTD7_OCTBM
MYPTGDANKLCCIPLGRLAEKRRVVQFNYYIYYSITYKEHTHRKFDVNKTRVMSAIYINDILLLQSIRTTTMKQ